MIRGYLNWYDLTKKPTAEWLRNRGFYRMSNEYRIAVAIDFKSKFRFWIDSMPRGLRDSHSGNEIKYTYLYDITQLRIEDVPRSILRTLPHIQDLMR